MTSGEWMWKENRYALYVSGHGVKGKTWKLHGAGLENALNNSRRKTERALKPLMDFCSENDLDMVQYIYSEYWDNDKSVKLIAEEFGVDDTVLYRLMERNRIPRRNVAETNQWRWDHPTKRMLDCAQELGQRGTEWMQSEEGRKINSENRLRMGFCGDDETRRLLSAANSGSRCHFWKGGISEEEYPPEFNERLKSKIRERDEYTCQECGKFGKCVHHIDFNKQNSGELNLITLCRSCHTITTNSCNRQGWIIHFKAMMARRFDLEEL